MRMNAIATLDQRLSNAGRLSFAGAGAGWFTSVMGTGILAICIAISPIAIPFARPLSVTLWGADVVLFAVLALLWLASFATDTRRAFGTLNDPVKAFAWGAPPMACFTIAVGFLKIGVAVLPPSLCVFAAQLLYIAGALGSAFTLAVVPFLMITRHELTQQNTYGTWLLPIVPPIVSSVPAALLVPSWPAAIRGDLLALAYAMFGAGIILTAITIVVFYSRLVYNKVPEGALVTTMWLVVGPLGQSVAGIIALGIASKTVWPQLAPGLENASLAYGVTVWGFGVYWLLMAIALTIRATRKGLPFNLGWWAFTFPVGVLVAGTDALYGLTGAGIFSGGALALLALLATLWLLVATKTVRGALGAAFTCERSAVRVATTLSS